MQDVDKLFNKPGLAEREMDRKVRQIVEHAAANVPFYREFKGVQSISQLPVVDKAIIKKETNTFIPIGIEKNKLRRVSTSGSHGIPAHFYQDRVKVLRKQADLIFLNNFLNYRVGDRHALIRTKPKPKLWLFLQNEILFLSSKRDLQSVQRFQIIQEAEKEYRLKIIDDFLFNGEEKIRNCLNSVLGNDAVIFIERVGDIEPLPSGKRPVVKNELMNSVLTF